MGAFTEKLAEELINKKIDCECCKVALLGGFVLCSGEFALRNKKVCVVIKGISKDADEFVKSLAAGSYGAKIDAGGVVDENASEKLLRDLDFLMPSGGFEMHVSEEIFVCETCAASFLRGAFLSAGRADIKISEDLAVSSGSGYKIVFTMNAAGAGEFAQVLAQFDIDVSVVEGLVYITGFENVRTFLAGVGATRCLLMLENENIARELRSQASRAVNAAEGNIKKTVAASAELLEMVKVIGEIIGVERLPGHLKDLCKLVLKEQGLSLNDIASKLGVSKSGANHRVRAIREIYRSIEN